VKEKPSLTGCYHNYNLITYETFINIEIQYILMENNTNSQIRYNFVNGKILDNYTVSNGLVIGSDFHGGEGLENLLNIAQEKGLTAVINGDVVNDYNFGQVANNVGYKFASQIQHEYLSEHLDEQDMQTYFFLEQLQKTGGDISPFLANVPESHHEEFKKGIEEIINYSKTEEFQEKITDVAKDFEREKLEEVQENSTKSRILYEVFMDAEARKTASVMNQYSETQVLFNKGNHEDTYFVEKVRQYLTNKEQIVDLTEYEGLYQIKQENGQEMSVAAMTNSVQNMPYLQEVMHPEEMNAMYSHMSLDEIKHKSMMSGNQSKEDIKNLEELIKQDVDYNRVFKDGEESLDIFLSHGQIGMPDKGYEVPYQGVAAYLSDKADLTIEGHIHSYLEEKNSFGDNMIRSAGQYGTIIKKDENGEIVTEKIEIDPEYSGGHNNEIPYDLEMMKQIVEEEYKKMITNPANNTDYDPRDSEKAA